MPEIEYAGGPVVDRVTALVLPILADLGLELYDLENAGGVVRVTITKATGLDLEDVALVTRLLSRELDHTDPIPGRYTLEVSSPGLERNLRRPDHFETAVGQIVAVRLHRPVAGTRRLQGTLVAVDETAVTIRLDDAALTEHRVELSQIERARTVFVWGPTPKPGKAPAASKGGAKKAAVPADDSPESDPTTQEAGAS